MLGFNFIHAPFIFIQDLSSKVKGVVNALASNKMSLCWLLYDASYAWKFNKRMKWFGIIILLNDSFSSTLII
jgi:hypothetical protein